MAVASGHNPYLKFDMCSHTHRGWYSLLAESLATSLHIKKKFLYHFVNRATYMTGQASSKNGYRISYNSIRCSSMAAFLVSIITMARNNMKRTLPYGNIRVL